MHYVRIGITLSSFRHNCNHLNFCHQGCRLSAKPAGELGVRIMVVTLAHSDLPIAQLTRCTKDFSPHYWFVA